MIERRVFDGPVTIKNLKCQQSSEFDMECDTKKQFALPLNDCSQTNYKGVAIAQSVLLGVLVIALYSIVMWFVRMFKGLEVKG